MKTSQNMASGLIVTRVEALGFRSLRYVSQRLGPFHVLVGPNASGKSAFLDVLAFLGDLQRVDLKHAIMGHQPLAVPVRATDPQHLTWMRRGASFELALEVAVPDALRGHLKNGSARVCRYEVTVDVSEPCRIVRENLWLKPDKGFGAERMRSEFPDPPEPPKEIIVDPGKRPPRNWRKVVFRESDPERATFHPETSGRSFQFRVPTGQSALNSLPPDEELFPVAARFKQMLAAGVQRIALSSEALRRPSPPGHSDTYLPDGSNLPYLVNKVAKRRDLYGDWTMHVREALPDVVRIVPRIRSDDGHRYLMVHYRNGLEAPSWLVSDGTLRFLALTLLAYLPEPTGPYLIEEPENGIHPLNVETVLQSLSSVYDAQVLLATHSPAIVRLASLDQMLCFARDEDRGADVVAGPAHPLLRDWQGVIDLGALLASGALE